MDFRFIAIILFLSFSTLLNAQIVQVNPASATGDDEATIIFDATKGNGELVGASKVYMHHGVIVNGPNGTEWQSVIGNWGMDDGIGQMTKVSGETDKWQFTMSPTIRSYFGMGAAQDIFRISMVFRSADGNTKGTINAGAYDWGTVASNLDMYFNLSVARFVELTAPTSSDIVVETGNAISVSGTASGSASTMKILIDEGSGFVEKRSQNNTSSITYDYVPTSSGQVTVKVTATITGQTVEDSKVINVTVRNPNTILPLPAGVEPGINYIAADPTKAILVLEAPGKSTAYVVGDMNNWTVDDAYQMNQTADGEFFWLEIDNLTAGQPYVFQYWVDGDIKIGDPYTRQVADPWNDQYIPNGVFPNLPNYSQTGNGIASVLQTEQSEFNWAASESSWTRPSPDHIVIYELLIRDFIASPDWDGLRDTLSYIKNLGVDAIEIMPFSEFEGNESWGYNNSYMFATDKYYGTADDIKEFIQAAHQEGLAVIMDIVLNHAFGQNPMAMLYFNNSTGKPTADNPWFNENTVGPFGFGNDFNHESTYTQALVDRVNKYWLEEFHIDGYRFDFTKGFTQSAPNNSLDAFDQSRIDILKRMMDQVKVVDPNAYIILEHFGQDNEEQVLASYGAKLWSNRSYDYAPTAAGGTSGAFTSMDRLSHVSYFNSHDERRLSEHLLSEGQSTGSYDIKNPIIGMERLKQAAAFTFLIPGPKLLWQFDELGYDIDINFNGRTGNKPLPWGTGGLGYYEDPLRQHIRSTYIGLLDIRKQVGPASMTSATTDHLLSGAVRRLSYDTDDIDLVVVGNFGLSDNSIDPNFSQTGWWYDYFSGDSIMVDNANSTIPLSLGEWHAYTSQRIGEGIPGAVEVYDNPVTISPEEFTVDQEITITFDAQKAWKDGTAGLVGADEVYFHSGVILESPNGTNWENTVGNLTDDGLGQMTSVGNDKWEIKLTPRDYYNLSSSQTVFRLGMNFRDASNTKKGKGFRDTDIYFNVASDDPFIQITPSDFDIDTQIKITFNALKGNRELVGASKVYMHSSMGLVDSEMPYDNAWNNVIGNWGQDDGVGRMTKVAGKDDQWEITLIPRQYYGLSGEDFPYWLAAVFRSADGNAKGTGAAGALDNGFIHTNQDFFIRNDRSVGIRTGLKNDQEISLFPNPTSCLLNLRFDNISSTSTIIEVIDITGKRQSYQARQVAYGSTVEVSTANLVPGLYIVRIQGDDFLVTQSFVKQ